MSAKPGDPSFVAPSDLTGERRDWHDGAVEKKAHRLLITGHVRITYADTPMGRVDAYVRGDTSGYEVALVEGEWMCSCRSSAEGQRCSHQAAVQLVTIGPE